MPRKSLETLEKRCPYCLSDSVNSNGYKKNYTSFFCKDCHKSFRYMGNYNKKEKLAKLSIVKSTINFNKILCQSLQISEGDYISIFFSPTFGIVINKQKQNGVLLKLKGDGNKSTLRFINSDLAQAAREEVGENGTISFYFINKKSNSMGIILKSEIFSNTENRQKIILEPFLGVRGNGTTSISAALRDLLKIKRGSIIFLYTDENDNIYMFNGEGTSYLNSEGFRCNSAGVNGFSNAYNITSTKLSIFLCNKYNVPLGNTFKIMLSNKIKIIDDIPMVRLIDLI